MPVAPGDTRVDEQVETPGLPVPLPGPGHLTRPRLLEQLGSPGAVPLVVVTGPPASGKSALVAEWVRRAEDSVRAGWIDFDQDQHDLWGSVTRCLADLDFDLSGEHPAGEPGQPAGDWLATSPTPSLTAGPRLVVVLDGLELTSARLAHQIDFVLRRVEGRLTFVITSRVDPLLPLADYRTGGKAVEVREADLRCTDPEARQVMAAAGARVGAADVAALNHRLGGWVGGLALAARAAHEAPDPVLAAAAINEGPASMQEYLLRQALDSRPEREREFLLRASVVDVLDRGLARRVAGPDAEQLAEQLAAAHLFLEPLPRPGAGWRLQPMLRDLLRARLALEDPAGWERAHRRAAGWYRDRGRVEPAIGHLVEAAAWPEVADLLVTSGQVLHVVTGGADDDIHAVASRIPDDLTTPGAHLVRAALALTRDAGPEASAELSLVPPAGRTTTALDATAAVLRAWPAAREGSVAEAEGAVAAAWQAVHRLPVRDRAGLTALRAFARLAEGCLHLRTGRWEDARRVLVTAADEAPEKAVRARTTALGLAALALALSGRLTDAGVTAARAVGLFEECGTPPGRRCPAPYLALGYVALERGDLHAARRHLDQAQESDPEHFGPVENAVRALVRAGQASAGSLPEGDPRLQEAVRQVATGTPPLADLLRLHAAWSFLPGDPRRAAAELDSVQDPQTPSALVARAAALRRTDPAAAILLLARAEGAPYDVRTEVQRLLTLADLQLWQGAAARGRSHLDAALDLAAPERLQRPFEHVSEPARRLLRTDTTLRVRHPWIVTTHPRNAAGGVTGGGAPAPSGRPREAGPVAPGTAVSGRRQGAVDLVEPLTAKEMEVLAHLNRLLDTDEIAEEMVVSVNTVRTHVRHVLRKLGVDRRNAAVRRAWELGLIPGPDAR